MRTRVRLGLLLQLAAIGALVGVVLLVVGLPLLAGRGGTLAGPALLAAAGAAAVVAIGMAVLGGGVARPVERMLRDAERLSVPAGDLPALGPPGEPHGPPLHRAAVAFERTVAALEAERARVAAQVAALERVNRELAEAHDSLVRSARLATVGRLAAGIAHEVGNPLGAITGYAELCRERLEAGRTDGAADFLARIAAESRRIDAIVRDLLDFARPSDLALRPVAVGPALEAALRLAGVQDRFRRVAVEARLPADLPAVLADERRLAQVFLNLLLNAGDAMGGEGSVTVTAAARAGGVEVRVADRGPGIPAADLPRVFDPFFTTKPPGQGTGLGLAVCHGIMESFGGVISAESGPSGACFVLRLRPASPPGA